jgi:hypothetical protein
MKKLIALTMLLAVSGCTQSGFHDFADAMGKFHDNYEAQQAAQRPTSTVRCVTQWNVTTCSTYE